ncbi:hypothetical protein BS78_K006300 [Paspalum vaginatum]|uniref:Legume lectin domain-containing protein n=1 Tax=Paspalum vaginatum TaxID=158149 RepID=A0A9W7XAQ6_9POAL|nr:hypothetical protein BS78_K006300 [Paspalum vaginatum]
MASAASSRTSSSELLLFVISTCSLLSLSHQQAANTNSAAPPPPPFSFSFDFTNPFSFNSADLRFESNATVHGNLVDLTCNLRDHNINNCAGRMSYRHKVPFYDNTTSTLASFNTTFTFAIKADGNTPLGDGLAFFLSAPSDDMPPDSNGGRFGLLSRNETQVFGARQFVAVEFDTYRNPPWNDPISNHIGIDVGTLTSLNTTSLPTNTTLNGTWMATVTFDNVTWMLNVSVSIQSPDHRPSNMEPFVVTRSVARSKGDSSAGSGGGVFSGHRRIQSAQSDTEMVLQLHYCCSNSNPR